VRILVCSHRFSPEIGGIETSSAALATEFAQLDHEVRLITGTGASDGLTWPFEVIRNPGAGALLRQARWCDIFFQNNISLQTLWPAFLIRRPWIIAHQTWLAPPGERPGWPTHLKRFLLRFGKNVAISHAVADHLGVRCEIIGNPYRESLFHERSDLPRDRDLVYLGRLVSDKGVETLVRALKELNKEALCPRLTIVGSGPEEETLRTLTSELGLDGQVTFAGAHTDEPLTRLLHAHRIMVVPSRWAEPFGIVALEGIACGCVVVGSSGGGLPEAIGPCGLTFPNQDCAALAAALRRLLTEDGLIAQLRAGAAAHLAKHTARAVAEQYLQLFAGCLP
jgi:glycosyltransferase involved in cell wall biosynthesis